MKAPSEQPDRRKVLLVDYDATWPSLASEEAGRIKAAMQDLVVEVHHIGSTAIPGIKAKPILDFVLEVRSLAAVDEAAEVLVRLGYSPRGEHGIPHRRYFTKESDGVRTHHLHAFESGDGEIERHLLFRDYLRAHPNVARDYQVLKEELAERFPADSIAYAEAKSAFVSSIVGRARQWEEGVGKGAEGEGPSA